MGEAALKKCAGSGVLTREGYIVERGELTQEDIEELTVTPEAFDPSEPPSSFEVFAELNDCTVALPRHWASKRFGHAEEFLGNVHDAPDLSFEGELRSELQKEAAKVSVEKLRTDGGGVLCLPTGTGKTVIALNVVCTLKVKTLIIVHKRFLMDQWAERIAQFVPSARVGRIQQNNVCVEGCDIVVGMLQSIAMREYGPEVFDGFGLVILDEVHVVPAPVFSRALFKVCSPCMLGMSATPERRDGMSCIISWFVGPVFMDHQLKGKAEVSVRVVRFPCSYKYAYGKAGMAKILSKLCENAERNDLLLTIVYDLVASGRKVILLSDRRSHCSRLMECLANNAISCALYLGGMKEQELKESETKDVLLATYSMAKEGLDIPGLDAVVLANPRSDVIQACGRVLHGKSTSPVIVDVVDTWCVGEAQFRRRMAYYEKSGFTIN